MRKTLSVFIRHYNISVPVETRPCLYVTSLTYHSVSTPSLYTPPPPSPSVSTPHPRILPFGLWTLKFDTVRKPFVKPIFHWKLGLRWLPNANEINTKIHEIYMANACPNFPFGTQRNLYSTDLHWGFALGTRILKFASPNTSHF